MKALGGALGALGVWGHWMGIRDTGSTRMVCLGTLGRSGGTEQGFEHTGSRYMGYWEPWDGLWKVTGGTERGSRLHWEHVWGHMGYWEHWKAVCGILG